MTDEKNENHQKLLLRNDSMEILPLDSNLLLQNSSFNFFETSMKKLKRHDDDQDILIVNSKKNLNKNFQNAVSSGSQKCNCRNTKCLKLYCECLRRGDTCKDCNCNGCENHTHS